MSNFKDQGNLYFKEQKYEEAIEQYQLGLQEEGLEDRLKAVLYCNMAICYKNLENNEDFINNINLSIQVDKTYEKPLNLRAAHYYKDEKWEESYEDYKLLKESFQKNNENILKQLEPKVNEIHEQRKKEAIDGLKSIGNSVLGYFGMSLDNFKLNQNPNGGSYNIQYQP